MVECDMCEYREIVGQNKFCRWHNAYIGWHGCENGERKPITNADLIRAMTDEELADEILKWFNWLNAVEWDDDRIINWLKQEAET